MYESSTEQAAVRLQNKAGNKIEHNKHDIVNVVLDKIERKCLIIDVACAFDIRVKGKEKEEIENYQELKREFK